MGQSDCIVHNTGSVQRLDQPGSRSFARRSRGLTTRRGVTARERRIIQLRVKGKSLRQIAEDVGSSKSRVFLVLKRLEPELKQALELAGYGLREAVTKMVEMTDATKTEIGWYKGIVMDEREVAENPINPRVDDQ